MLTTGESENILWVFSALKKKKALSTSFQRNDKHFKNPVGGGWKSAQHENQIASSHIYYDYNYIKFVYEVWTGSEKENEVLCGGGK